MYAYSGVKLDPVVPGVTRIFIAPYPPAVPAPVVSTVAADALPIENDTVAVVLAAGPPVLRVPWNQQVEDVANSEILR